MYPLIIYCFYAANGYYQVYQILPDGSIMSECSNTILLNNLIEKNAPDRVSNQNGKRAPPHHRLLSYVILFAAVFVITAAAEPGRG